VVGERAASDARYVVPVAITAVGAPVVEAEARHLDELGRRVRPSVREALSSVVLRVAVGDLPGVVLTAVPGVATTGSPSPRGGAADAEAVLAWLSLLWADTSGSRAPVDVGREAYDLILARFAGSRRAAPALGALQHARAVLAENDVPRAVSHGCLCPQHLYVSEGRAVGVDDWGRARFDADPLRDLGSWVVRATGPDVGNVLGERTADGRAFRDFIAGGLDQLGLSPRLWRDVLVLALGEAAAEGLAGRDATALGLLTEVSQELDSSATKGRTGP